MTNQPHRGEGETSRPALLSFVACVLDAAAMMSAALLAWFSAQAAMERPDRPLWTLGFVVVGALWGGWRALSFPNRLKEKAQDGSSQTPDTRP